MGWFRKDELSHALPTSFLQHPWNPVINVSRTAPCLWGFISWCGILWVYNITWGLVQGSEELTGFFSQSGRERSLGPKLGGSAKAASESKTIIVPLSSLLPLLPPFCFPSFSISSSVLSLFPTLFWKAREEEPRSAPCHEWPTCVLAVYLPGAGLHPQTSTCCGCTVSYSTPQIFTVLWLTERALCWKCQKDAKRQSPSWEGLVWGPCLRLA